MPSLFEHQIHQNIIYTSNRRHSIHINKNSSIGLKTFLHWCCNNRRRSACTTKLWHSWRSPVLVTLRTSWYLFVTQIKGDASHNL